MSPLKAQMILKQQAALAKSKPKPPPPPGSPPVAPKPPKAPAPPPAPKPTMSAKDKLETLPDAALKAKAESLLTKVDPAWDRKTLIKKLLDAGVTG